MHVWRLKRGADRRFRLGHPWIYSNELINSPKGITPGQPIELQDAGGKFLARGYGNPSSLIAFRTLTRQPEVNEPLSTGSIHEALRKAQALRHLSGLADVSYRLCFGEADSLPGLIIDRYALENGSQAFSIQAHTAGIDLALPAVFEALENLCGADWKKTALILRNDVQMRKLEGLEPQEPRIIRNLPEAGAATEALASARILVAAAAPSTTPVIFETDLVEGQKTGFFLDQSANIQLATRRLAGLRAADAGPLRVLDLCCYVGQWSTQLAHAFSRQGISAEFTLVDASAKALEFAKKNVERQGARASTLKTDVMTGLGSLKDRSFDLVVCDPPALIKGRKDIPVGTHAYLQLNTQVFRLLRDGGGVVSCSCSALLEEDSFLQTLSKAAYRNRRQVRWTARGCQGPDHPMLAEFPEGKYLKCWIGSVTGSTGAFASARDEDSPEATQD